MNSSLDDDTDYFMKSRQKRLDHPFVCTAHVFFRFFAIIFYILCSWFIDSFVITFVAILFLLSMDFWVVKNVSGRLLVGLRWWNEIDEKGDSHWFFESRSKDGEVKPNAFEHRIFWVSLVIAPLIWTVFFLGCIFSLKFQWLIIVAIAIGFTFSNLYGYLKCRYGSEKQMSNAAVEFFGKQIFRNAAAAATSSSQA